MSGPPWPALRLVRDEPDQVFRLARFRQQHPAVSIREGVGYWQAWFPEPGGETIITRYTLRQLLDQLEALDDGKRGPGLTGSGVSENET